MMPAGMWWGDSPVGIGLTLAIVTLALGIGPIALLLVTALGWAAAVSGEPRPMANSEGQSFGEQRIPLIQSGAHTQIDVVNVFGYPQTKTFTQNDEDWAYRSRLSPSRLRASLGKALTTDFRDGKVEEVHYSISALYIMAHGWWLKAHGSCHELWAMS